MLHTQSILQLRVRNVSVNAARAFERHIWANPDQMAERLRRRKQTVDTRSAYLHQKGACGDTRPRFLECKKHEPITTQRVSVFRRGVQGPQGSAGIVSRAGYGSSRNGPYPRRFQRDHLQVDGQIGHRNPIKIRGMWLRPRILPNQQRWIPEVVGVRRQPHQTGSSPPTAGYSKRRGSRESVLGRRVPCPPQERCQMGQQAVEHRGSACA